MTTRLKLVMWALPVMLSAALVGPGAAAAQMAPLDTVVPGTGATLYEMNENMQLKGKKLVHRKAVSQLMGVAAQNTPLCPLTLPPGMVCTVNAEGKDNINLATGLGKFNGTFTVVVQGDNNTDSPEFVVASGKFAGDMDFSPAILLGIPYGTVVGKMTMDGTGAKIPFTGTFRLPFTVPGLGNLYLINPAQFPTGGFALINLNEYALGYPTVRFEIKF